MNIFSFLYHTIFYQPLLNVLVVFYTLVPGRDLGIAIILLTLFVRLALHPFSARALQSQQKFAQLQPEVQELQKKFQHQKDELMRRTLELYRKHNFNPLGTFPLLLLQFPFLIALFRVFGSGFDGNQPNLLYPFVQNSGPLDPSFLGIINLSQSSLPLALLASVSQFLQGKYSSQSASARLNPAKSPVAQARATQKFMIYGFSAFTLLILTGFFGLTPPLPSALALYWIASNTFAIGEQWYLGRKLKTQSATSPLFKMKNPT